MIKQILILTLLLGLFACSNHDDSETKTNGFDNKAILADTCEIWDTLASQPFLFKSWNVSLDSVLMFLPNSAVLERLVTPSHYNENSNDSITKIKIGRSVIEYTKTSTFGFIEQAIIVDPNINFIRNIHIGDTYQNVCKKLIGLPKTGNKFRKIYINSGEATSTLIFEFSENKLSKVIYWPYTG